MDSILYIGFYLIKYNLYHVITGNTGKLYKQSGATEPAVAATKSNFRTNFARIERYKS